jgi:methylmalonyl-CoA mutase C-terminal domain/subunit
MAIKVAERIPRVLVAKIGLDGHSRGAHVVAQGLRDAGMEVIYTGIRQTPAAVARIAVQEDVDVIGISSMVGAHVEVVKKLRKELADQNAADIPIMIGGVIPEEDYAALKAAGVGAIFPPGSEVKQIVQYIMKINAWVPEVPTTLAGTNPAELHLVGTKCEKCGRVFFPVRKNCPRCLEESTKDIALSSEGVLATFSLASVAPPGYSVPHAQGYIDLSDNGPRIFSLLADFGDGSSLKVGGRMKVKLVELGKDKDDKAIIGFRFRPAAEAE